MGSWTGRCRVLATADDPGHAVHRRMLVPQLAAKRIRATEPFIAETFDWLWSDNLRDGRIEWMSAVANRLPMMVVTRLIRVPDGDVDLLIPRRTPACRRSTALPTMTSWRPPAAAAVELSGYIFEQFQRAIDEGAQDNLLGDMATAYAHGDIDQVTAAVIMVILFSAGGVHRVAAGQRGRHPGRAAEIQRRLRDDPQLLGPFIEECLRFEPPFRGHYRHVRVDTERAPACRCKPSSRLLLLWGAANRDPGKVRQPWRVQPGPSGQGPHHFGKGVHFCVGAALARWRATVVLRLLLDRTVDRGAGSRAVVVEHPGAPAELDLC